MITNPPEDAGRLIETLREAMVGLVQQDGADLTMRQFGIFLICYLEREPQTVRGLAQKLNVYRPVISRGLDRLEEFRLVRRKLDLRDQRSVLVTRTKEGKVFLQQLKEILMSDIPMTEN